MDGPSNVFGGEFLATKQRLGERNNAVPLGIQDAVRIFLEFADVDGELVAGTARSREYIGDGLQVHSPLVIVVVDVWGEPLCCQGTCKLPRSPLINDRAPRALEMTPLGQNV